jgi:anti-sigma regulatory factor (Ser/Thr protein kinase)
VANVIVHAYPPGRVGTLTIAADIEGDEIEIVITDEGQGFRPYPSILRVVPVRLSPVPAPHADLNPPGAALQATVT